MSTEYLTLALDLLILAGLGGFMYYALRLSKALSVFRTYRGDFEDIMNQLTKHIEEAQNAIEDLKETSTSSGENLRKSIKDAQFLVDDLQFMTETGNNLAKRLEASAEKGSRTAQKGKSGADDPSDFAAENVSSLSKHRSGNNKSGKKKQKDDDTFAIHDHEFESDDGMDMDLDDAINDLTSEAEKELYKALKNTKK